MNVYTICDRAEGIMTVKEGRGEVQWHGYILLLLQFLR